jgi:hypothetical protein
VPRRNHLVPGTQEGVPDEFDHLVRAVPEDDILLPESELRRNGLAQVEPPAIRIKVDALNGLMHRRERLGRRPKRVFVRGQLDDLRRREPQLAGHVLDRFARLVGDEIAKLRVG